MADREEFLKLLLHHEAEVRAFIGSLVRDRHARDDVLQEVALTMWQQFDRYDPRRSFGAWARGFAARKIMERRHQDRRFPAAFPPEAIPAVLAAFDRTERAAPARLEALQECLGNLPGRSRELLGLRYGQELAGQEIARRTSRTLDAVYQALSRIRSALEECIRRRLSSHKGGD